ncbi:MAG: ATP-binding cassette domain-containing protein, partial [Gammaproteobacteria bacterium]|nr:ATP-binding cassette domain-containing protein [Gammaproteobacteria bacterium]
MPSNSPPTINSSSTRDAREPLLEITGLNSHYGPVQVIHDISLSVHSGELVALVGGNGAGKTTLLHTLSSLHPPSAGTIR